MCRNFVRLANIYDFELFTLLSLICFELSVFIKRFPSGDHCEYIINLSHDFVKCHSIFQFMSSTCRKRGTCKDIQLNVE